MVFGFFFYIYLFLAFVIEVCGRGKKKWVWSIINLVFFVCFLFFVSLCVCGRYSLRFLSFFFFGLFVSSCSHTDPIDGNISLGALVLWLQLVAVGLLSGLLSGLS